MLGDGIGEANVELGIEGTLGETQPTMKKGMIPMRTTFVSNFN